MTMKADSLQSQISKALGIAAMGVALAGPMPAMADGAASKSTVYRARNSYGQRVLGLADAAAKGDFDAFLDKRAVNGFDLFISGSNRMNGVKDKAAKKAELELEKAIYEAVKAKDKAGLKKNYDEFIKVADLAPLFRPGELGQTDTSGYSPTWGTDRYGHASLLFFSLSFLATISSTRKLTSLSKHSQLNPNPSSLPCRQYIYQR